MIWARKNAKLLLLVALLTVPILGAFLSRSESGEIALIALGTIVALMVIALLKG